MRDRPAVVEGRVEARPQLTLTATIDHRFIDGAQGGVLAKVVREIMEDPSQLDGPAQKSAAAADADVTQKDAV